MYFYYQDPLVALSLLLSNHAIRGKMIFDEKDLSPEERASGHIFTSAVYREAKALLDAVPAAHYPGGVKLLLLGWWSDATNLSCGSMVLSSFSFFSYFCVLLVSSSFAEWLRSSFASVVVQSSTRGVVEQHRIGSDLFLPGSSSGTVTIAYAKAYFCDKSFGFSSMYRRSFFFPGFLAEKSVW